MKDLTRIEGNKAVGPQLEPIISDISKYSLEQLKRELQRILCNPDTSVSKEKALQYTTSMSNIYSLQKMQMFLADIYLASAGMGVTAKKRGR